MNSEDLASGSTEAPRDDSTKTSVGDSPRDPNLGRRIGRFHIKSVIASGGMGTVYLAMQDEPRRHVALKLMKHGVSSRSALRRFKFEAQLLARLQHPGIAQIYESGTHDDGSGGVPYFAIEYVPAALPLTTYASENNLDIAARLELFTEVCDAVAHGHQKGIIHRDLKPANILVDSHGRVKIIDFGVARATDSDLAVTTLQTDLHQIIGTLQYMSPEQCGNDAFDIDTSSDVYALGVVLYELLCDQLPYDISGTLLPAAVEMIRNQEPARPSTINRSLRGDLETIVLKALDKGRDRRYRNAAEFGDDIKRYVNDEAIVARPPSLGYQVRLFSRRYRTAFRAIVAVGAVLVVATTGSTILWIQAIEATNRARDAEEKMRDALAEAETLRDAFRRQAGVSNIVAARAMREAYIANIVAAQASIHAHQIGNARLRLDQAPSELRGWEWEFLYAWLDQSLATLRGHEDAVWSVAFSPDGLRIASASKDKTIRLWNAAGGDELRVLRGHEGEVYSVAFSPEGSRLASGSSDKTLRLWDVSSGEALYVRSGHDWHVLSVVFSPDGSRIASTSVDNTVRLWDAASGKTLGVLQGHESWVRSVAFSPDGLHIVSGSRDSNLRLWDAARGQEIAVLSNWHEGSVRSVAYSPDGSRIASASNDKTVRLWDAADGSPVQVLRGHEDVVVSAAFSPDGLWIASASGDKTIRLWDVATGRQLAVRRGHEDGVASVAFSPDGSRIVSGSSDSTIRIWDASVLDNLVGHTARVRSVTFSPDGSRLATASYDQTIRLWDVATGQLLAVLRGHTSNVISVAFSPDGSRIVSGSWDKTIRLWDADSGRELAARPGHESGVISVAFSPDGSRIASASDDKTVRLWDAASGAALSVLDGHDDGVLSVTFSPDGLWIASASGDKTVRLWDAPSGRTFAVLRGHEGEVTSVAFSPDGLHIASGSSDNTVRLWDVFTGQLLSVLRGHEGGVTSVVFSPDGSRIVSGSASDDSSVGTIRLWDAASGNELLVLRGHESSVDSVAFSPEGSRIVSGLRDGTIRLWDAVAYRDRVAQRDEALRAENTIIPLIDKLFSAGLLCPAVAERVRNDESLTDQLRHAAVNLVLKRCSEMREQARRPR